MQSLHISTKASSFPLGMSRAVWGVELRGRCECGRLEGVSSNFNESIRYRTYKVIKLLDLATADLKW